MINNKTFISVIIGIVLPTILLLVLIKLNLVLQNVLQADGLSYWSISEHIMQYKNFSFNDVYHSYLYGLYISFARVLTDGSVQSVLIFQSVVFILSIYYFIKTCIDDINIYSLIFLSLSPFSIYYAWSMLTEALYIPLYFIALSFIYKYYRFNIVKYKYMALILFAFIAITKNHLLIFAIVSMLILILDNQRYTIKNITMALLIILVLVVTVKLPDTLSSKKNDTKSVNIIYSSLYMGMHEFEKFPFSLEPQFQYVDKVRTINVKESLIEDISNNPMSAIRSYIYRIFRIWTPMNHYENKGIGIKLSKIYGSLVFIFFIMGIYFALKYEKNRKLLYMLLIPMLVLWLQQIFFHTESRYISIIRLNQLFFAGYFIFYLLNHRLSRRKLD